MNKPHKIIIKNKTPGRVSHGANTQVLLDGEPLRYVKSVNLNVTAKELSVVTLEMFADVEIEDYEIGRLEKTTLIGE